MVCFGLAAGSSRAGWRAVFRTRGMVRVPHAGIPVGMEQQPPIVITAASARLPCLSSLRSSTPEPFVSVLVRVVFGYGLALPVVWFLLPARVLMETFLFKAV